MRAFLNSILSFIGSTALTDEEFGTLDPELDTTDEQAVYDALSPIVEARETISDIPERLTYYFKAKGFDFAVAEGSSNVLVGAALDCE